MCALVSSVVLMLASVKQLLPRLSLLLILAAALGCFIFLFDLFAGLRSSDDTGLLDQADRTATTIEVLSGAQLTAALAAFLCWVLAAATAWLCWQRLKGPRGKRRLTVLLSVLAAVAFFATGLYLGAVVATQGSLPSGNLPYDHHQVDLTGVEPLGLVLLAAFALSVAVVGILKPRLVIIPVLVWLALALMYGMFGSAAIRGLNLFDRPARLQPVLAYQEIVHEYVPAGQGSAAADPAQMVPGPYAPPESPSPSLRDDPDGPPDPDAVAALVLDLGSSDPEVAERATTSLAAIGAEVIGLETGAFWSSGIKASIRFRASPPTKPVRTNRDRCSRFAAQPKPVTCARRWVTPIPTGFGPSSIQ